METRLSNKQKWLKTINLTVDDELYIGIDVHKKSYHIAFWLNNASATNFITSPIKTEHYEVLLWGCKRNEDLVQSPPLRCRGQNACRGKLSGSGHG